jgi:glycosyltransferase involved in cell wall biosynthesis
MDVKVSLVITSYSAQRINDILELLESVKNQTLKDMETIYIVERSEELYKKISDFIEEHYIDNIKVIFSNENLGLSGARNLGIMYSKGEIVSFVDDDVVLYTDWAEKMYKAFDNNSIIGVTGSAFPLWEHESLKWLPEEFYWLISCTAWTGWTEPRIVRGAFGANMAFRKEAFNENTMFSIETGYRDGFHHQPISDDLEFSLRIRRRTKKNIIFYPSACVWHRVSIHRLNLGFVAARSHQVGCTRRLIKKLYPVEFGQTDQEENVISGIIKLLFAKLPKEFFNNPSIALKKMVLTFTILLSTATGYMFPIFRYKLKHQIIL